MKRLISKSERRELKALLISARQHPLHSSQINLQSFLLLPVQRLPRYKLLIENVVKHDSFSPTALDALRTVRELVGACNEAKRANQDLAEARAILRDIRVCHFSVGGDKFLRLREEGVSIKKHFQYSSLELAGFTEKKLVGSSVEGQLEDITVSFFSIDGQTAIQQCITANTCRRHTLFAFHDHLLWCVDGNGAGFQFELVRCFDGLIWGKNVDMEMIGENKALRISIHGTIVLYFKMERVRVCETYPSSPFLHQM